MRQESTTRAGRRADAVRQVSLPPAPGRWVVPALMLASAAAAAWSMSAGPGLSPDSVVYVNAADSWLDRGSLEAFGRPVTLWPPGYPLVLALLARAGLDLQLGIVALNLVSVAAAVWLTHRLARIVGLGARASVGVAGVVALSVSTLRVGSMAWSEPLFLVAVLAALVTCSRWLRRAPKWWEIGLAATLVSLACVLRYAGVALLPAVVVGCVIGVRQRARPAWIRAVVLAAGSSIGIAAVVARNVSLGVGPTGDRVGTGMSPVRALGHLLRALGQVVVPEPGGLMPLVSPGIGPGLTVALTALWFALGALVLGLWLWGVWTQLRVTAQGVCAATFSVAYVSVLLAATVTAGVDPPNDRLLQPVLPAVVALVALGGRALGHRWAAHAGSLQSPLRPRTLRRVAGVALAAWVVASAAATLVVADRAANSGIGYNSAAVESSPLTAAIRQLPVSAGVAFSDPWQGYWVLRREVVSVYEGDFVDRVRSGAVDHLVLYPGSTNKTVTESALRLRGLGLQRLSSGPDGVLYRVTAEASTGRAASGSS